MPMQVCTGAQMTCSFGAAPSVFSASSTDVMTTSMPAGVIMDHVPMKNVPSFGMCTSEANPAVAAATAAALGTPTPSACVPVLPAPWVPGVPTVLIDNQPALDNTCKLMCAFGGVVTFVTPGQFTHQIP